MSAPLTISPARNLTGAVRPPGDKSISHRYAVLSALAEGASKLEHYSTGADCQSTLACLAALGVDVRREGADTIHITGRGLHGLSAPAAPLDAGNSGTTIRLLSGILAAQPFASEIFGDASLSRRPMRRVIQPLRLMGAALSSAPEDRPPLRFSPVSGLHGLEYAMPVASAQVKSALLLAALYARGRTVITEPEPTRDHTEVMLRQSGVPLELATRRVSLEGPAAGWPGRDFRIPGDASSAAFFLCAAALFPEAGVLIEDVLLNPTRAALLDLLRRMGARIEIVHLEPRGGELAGSLHVSGPASGPLRGTRISGAETVALIDEIPVLAVLATAAEGGIEFADAAELRVKESDRIAAIAENLRALGAECDVRPDGLRVPGPQTLRGGEVKTRADHRIAMAFAVAALRSQAPVSLDDPACAAISYPEFFHDLERLAER